MFTIGVQSEFSAAHFHSGAGKNCRRIHGHNYRIEAQVASRSLRKNMVVDFDVVRVALQEALGPWDHRLLNEVDEFKRIETTTENICRLLFVKLSSLLPPSVLLRKIIIWETEDCWASYSEEDAGED
ncbi:MAG: 6-carboxytetrahydropterin synthase [Candidatus Euphemobacter frigidus]|nr:6-carboxytetrahydropterin synthase [Candidatus Euphemobacter frigidus]MDP8275267.1 6-carboxytetrahydropterin synthase [Candidatus Euphemobacter frigidus]